MTTEVANCEICGEPMPPGEEMFKFHGYSGECPKPPMRKPMHPASEWILKFFACEHLPEKLREISMPFGVLAREVARRADNPETTVALRKLLEAKDAAVRAAL